MKHLRLLVPQGIGDIYWTYQVAEPHADSIEYEVLQEVDNYPWMASRADEFLRLLPKVKRVTQRIVPRGQYNELVNRRYDFSEVHAAGGGYYAVNNALENGVRIEDCSLWPIKKVVDFPERPTPALPGEQYAIHLHGGYVVLYVSVSSMNPEHRRIRGVWGVDEWVSLVNGCYEMLPGGDARPRLVVVGAEYDRPIVDHLVARLEHLSPLPAVGFKMESVIELLRRADLFLNYQSGLSVIADQLGTPQMWMCFPCYPKMLYSWCRQDTRDDGRFVAATFDAGPMEILDLLRRQSCKFSARSTRWSPAGILDGRERPRST